MGTKCALELAIRPPLLTLRHSVDVHATLAFLLKYRANVILQTGRGQPLKATNRHRFHPLQTEERALTRRIWSRTEPDRTGAIPDELRGLPSSLQFDERGGSLGQCSSSIEP